MYSFRNIVFWGLHKKCSSEYYCQHLSGVLFLYALLCGGKNNKKNKKNMHYYYFARAQSMYFSKSEAGILVVL